MPDPLTLRADARVAGAAAERCLLLADQIDLRRRLLMERVEPAREAHRPEVWSSRAADWSRDQLNRYVAPALWHISTDLAATAIRLRSMAESLEDQARALLASADEVEAAGPISSIVVDARDASLGPEVPTALDR